jgi:hypothetical protein
MNLSFEEWESLHEGQFFDKIKNFLSRSVGGDISNLDELLSSYRRSENDYIKDWDEGSIEKDKLEIEISQSKSDPAEIKKLERMMKRNRDVHSTAEKARMNRSEAIDKKARSIIKGNERLSSYWDVEISRVNAEISEKLHKKAKSLNDELEASRLYDIYQKSLFTSKEKEEQFKSKFGSSFVNSGAIKPGKEIDLEIGEGTDGSQELYLNLPIKDFASKVKTLTPKERKALVSRLIKERNERYVAMDIEQDTLIKQLDSKKIKGKELEEEKNKIKEAKQKYLEEIRDLRGKITIARRND